MTLISASINENLTRIETRAQNAPNQQILLDTVPLRLFFFRWWDVLKYVGHTAAKNKAQIIQRVGCNALTMLHSMDCVRRNAVLIDQIVC